MIAVIAAGNGGIGQALIQQLLARGNIDRIYASYHQTSESLTEDPRVVWAQTDLTSDSAVADWLSGLDTGHIDWLINCAGLLHTADKGPEKSLREIDADFFTRNMQVNCLPTLLLARHAAPLLKATGAAAAQSTTDTRIFATVSAKVGSIEDNRLGGWYSYRASKAALNMCLKNIAIEWRRQLPEVCVASLHPGTTDTRLSKPFQKNVPDGSLFESTYTATKLIDILQTLTAEQSGRFWSWNGDELPW
jgi:NAD(P)-dependent dehydrogenase (short-subunit alcohol dehydrogenase family)